MTDHSYKTDLYITLDGATLEYEAKVFFSHHAGYAGDRVDSPEDATVELYNVHVMIPGRDAIRLGPPTLIDALNEALQGDMFSFVKSLAEEAAEARGEKL